MNFKKHESNQKLRGGYYTPKKISDLIVDYIKLYKPKEILEPSSGDGIFVDSIREKLTYKPRIDCFEIYKKEIIKIKKKFPLDKKIKLHNLDFLNWYLKNISKKISYDAILGNPPFIRYQYLDEKTQIIIQQIFDNFNLNFTKHTNIWVCFVVISIFLLRKGGVLGMVIPSELINVMHSSELRKLLVTHMKNIKIIEPYEKLFDALQGTIILLAEKKRVNSFSSTIYLSKIKNINNKKSKDYFGKHDRVRIEAGVDRKWTKFFLEADQLELLQKISKSNLIYKFNDIADADVGIVTGCNKFFLVSDEIIKNYNLNRFSRPMFGKSEHCSGIIYDDNQHQINKLKGYPTNFLQFAHSNKISELNKKYIKLGEKSEINKRYKCRIRKPWFVVPSVYSSKIGMLKRSHGSPKLIYNSIDALTTDTAYRIKTINIDPKLLVYIFNNSLTSLSCEIEGRSYGGGVLELVPSEINNLIIPKIKKIKFNLEQLNKDILNSSLQDVILNQDKFLLSKIGLNSKEIKLIQNAVIKIRKRRLKSE